MMVIMNMVMIVVLMKKMIIIMLMKVMKIIKSLSMKKTIKIIVLVKTMLVMKMIVVEMIKVMLMIVMQNMIKYYLVYFEFCIKNNICEDEYSNDDFIEDRTNGKLVIFMIIFQDVNLLMKMSILMNEMKIMTLQASENPIGQKQDILVMKDEPYDRIKKLS